MWSFGCIVAELYQNLPLFAGESDIEQLGIVTGALGEPPFFWQDLPDFNKIIFNTNDQTSLWLDNLEQSMNTRIDNKSSIPKVLDLIQSVLKYTQRKTANQLFTTHRLFNEIRQTGIDNDKLVKPTIIKQLNGPNKKK